MRRIIVVVLIAALFVSGAYVAWIDLEKPAAPPPAGPISVEGQPSAVAAAPAEESPPAVTLPPLTPAAPAYAFLRLPVDCRPGRDCWILDNVDLDPGPGVKDHACGARASDGHDGTDIAVRDIAAMKAGVRVKAAAAGKIFDIRDGVDDGFYTDADAAALAGRDCGNGVVIDHGAGWRTVYCHMMKGSVAVKPGQEVGAGAHLGYVGMSGKAEFPHLHFGVMQGGKRLDPFLDPSDGKETCHAGPGASLWLPEAAAQLAYSPLDLVMIGAADSAVDDSLLLRGEYEARTRIAPTAPAMLAWIVMAGVEPGDRYTLRLTGPDGRIIAERGATLARRRAREVIYAGVRRRAPPWDPGTYRIAASVARGELRREGSTTFTVP